MSSYRLMEAEKAIPTLTGSRSPGWPSLLAGVAVGLLRLGQTGAGGADTGASSAGTS